MGHWEGREGQDVRRSVRQQLRHLGKRLPELFHHSVQLAMDLCGRQLLVNGAHHGGHTGLGALGYSGEQVGHEVSAAALPTRPSEHRGDGVLQPLVSIGGNQFHPAEPSGRQRPQEGQPERAVLAGPYVHAQDLTLPFGIDPRRHHHADVHDAAALPNLLRQAVQPHVGVGTTVQGPTQETVHHFVQVPADARHLAAGDAVAAQSLDQVIHPPSGHALHIGLLDHRQQGLLAAPPRFQQAGEVAALPQLGNVQLHGAHPGIPGAVAVAVAVGDPLRAAFAVLSADLGGNLGVHDAVHQNAQGFPQKVQVSVHTALA